MCRLFGYKTKNPKKTNNLLIKSLKDFRILSKNGCVPCGIERGHNDGWGIVAYKDGVPCLYYRSTSSILDDYNFDKFIEILKEIKPDIVISHLRKLSIGLKNINNTQPFILNNFSLSHNGTIFYNNISTKNISDSLYFFNDVNKKSKPVIDFNNIYKKTYLEYKYTAMNMIFSDGINLFAIKNINNSHPQYIKLCFNEYYTIFSFKNKNFCIYCSEKLPSLKSIKASSLISKKLYKF